MKLRLLKFLGAWAGLTCATAAPVTLTWSAQESGSCVCLTNGTPLAAGATVRLGYFDIDETAVRNLFTEPAILDTHFTVLATTSTGNFGAQTYADFPQLSVLGTNFAEAPGCFATSVVFNPELQQNSLSQRRYYIWATNGATVADSTQHGIFSHHTWEVNASAFGVMKWDLSQVSLTDPADVLLGHRGPQLSAIVGGTVLRLTNTNQLKIDLADDDHDGASGLLEQAFAMNPAVADTVQLPQIVLREGLPALEYVRKSGGIASSDGAYTADGLRYVVEISSNLSSWQSYVGANEALLSVSPGSTVGTETVSLNLAPTSLPDGCKFARVRIERVE